LKYLNKIPLIRNLPNLKGARLRYLTSWKASPSYWKLKRRWENYRFRLRRFLFRLRFRAQNEKESLSALREILVNLVKPILIASIIIIGLDVVEFVLVNQEIRTSSPPWSLHDTLVVLRSYIQKDRAIYANALSALIQISGTFLGLYFAAISVVISTVYARVQGDVRSLVMRDKAGDRYVGLIAMLGVASSLLMGAMALGRQPGVLNLIFVIGLAACSIYGCVVLGFRIFYFFDPPKLVDHLIVDLIRWIEEASVEGHWWEDSSFQSHYQGQAEEVLRTYHNIVYLANREEHLQSKALIELASRGFFLLRYYAHKKTSIPSNSQWFKRTYKHPEWFTSPDTSVRLALNTGTPLQPQHIPDLLWLEDEIERTVAHMLRGLFERQDLLGAYSFSNSAQQCFHVMAGGFAIDEALRMFRAFGPLVREQIHKMKPNGDQETEIYELRITLGLIDAYALGFINILLGLSDRLQQITAESLSEQIKKVYAGDSGTVYKSGLPRAVIRQLEDLDVKLQFEDAVEGHVFTPIWYRQQLAALSFARFIESSVNNLVHDLEIVFPVEAESLIADGRDLFAAQLVERGLEACNKFSFHFAVAKQCVENLEKMRRLQDIPWPSLDWSKYEQRINSVRERLVVSLSRILPALSKLPRNQLPDYFGHAYSIVANECYSALTNSNETLFEKIFREFFDAGLAANRRIVSSTEIFDDKLRLGLSAQPLIEMFEISGYALIYSELDEKKYWPLVTSIWDDYFQSVPDALAAAKSLLSLIGYKESIFGLFPRDTLQTEWRIELNRQLEKRGIPGMMTFSFSGNYEAYNHRSPLITVLIRGNALFSDAKLVFVAAYLKDKFPEIDVSSVRGANSLFEQLKEAKTRGSENNAAE